MSDSYITVKLDMPKILNKVENREFGLFLAQTWKRLINPYTPHREGFLKQHVIYRPFEFEYIEDYARYMYYGEVYIDPVFKAGGFTNNGGVDWVSRKDVKKIPSGRKFNYRRDKSKQATDHWDKAAEQAGQKDLLIEAANLYLHKK